MGVTGGSAMGGPSGSGFGEVGVCCEYVMLIDSFYTEDGNGVCIVKYTAPQPVCPPVHIW